MRRMTTLFLVVLAFGFGFAACGGGGSGSKPGDQDLVLKKFLVVDKSLNSVGADGSTDVYRDARLYFEFNVPVDMSSVSDRTIRIGIPSTTAGLWTSAEGRFEPVPGQPNAVLFNPTFTATNPGTTPDNPLGFLADTPYEIQVYGARDSRVNVQNTFGDPLVQSFFGDFRTSSRFLPTTDQPRITGFDPLDGETGVGSKADILVYFSEPMKPDSFIQGTTVIVLDELSGRPVLGEIRFLQDLQTMIFRPTFGYGRGIDDPDPAQAGVPVSVRVTTGVTNLAGTRIPQGIFFQFRTIYDPEQPDYDDLRESFNTNIYEDTTYTGTYPAADWNGGSGGALTGVFTNGTWINQMHNNTVTFEPWGAGQIPCTWQTYFTAAEIGGTGRTFTGFDWRKYHPGAVPTITVSNTQVFMAHTQLTNLNTTFTSNYSDTPVQVVFATNYSYGPGGTSGSPLGVWQAGPAYNANWQWNGVDHLLLEVQHTGCSNNLTGGVTFDGSWLLLNPATGPRRTAYTGYQGSGTVATSNDAVYDIVLYYLIAHSEARSLWYDTEKGNPRFLAAIINKTTPGAATADITFQGALLEEGVVPPQADEGEVSAWTSNLTDLTGFRFVRFHALFQGDASGAPPVQASVEEIVFPFVFEN